MTARTIVNTELAPAAIGPYSQAVSVGELVFASGQIALEPGASELAGTTVEEQTELVLRNLGAVLEAAGASLDSVVKTTVYLKQMDDFAAFNAVYARHFGSQPPARATVAVSGLPKGGLVEIDAIALRSEPADERKLRDS